MKKYSSKLKENNTVIQFYDGHGTDFTVDVVVLPGDRGDLGLKFSIGRDFISLNEEEVSELVMKLEKIAKTLK